MHFLRDSCVSSVFESSFTPRKLGFSVTAYYVVLTPTSQQSTGVLLSFTKKLLFLDAPLIQFTIST